MHEPLAHILSLATTARYNIKAVVQQTQVHVSTLRAWEQRYGIPQPLRSAHGHRLYSPRDVAIIKWLKQCTEDGLSISHAVALLRESRVLDGGNDEPIEVAATMPAADSGWADLQEQLIDALLVANMPQAHTLVNAAAARYSAEMVVLNLYQPVLALIGERWARSQSCVAEEHLVTNFIRQRLLVQNQVLAPFLVGPRLVCGCVPGEDHELGLLMFATLMELRGWEVLYLGQNVALHGLEYFLQHAAPALVCFSVTMIEHYRSIVDVAAMITQIGSENLVLVYGGGVFNEYPELLERMPPGYLGSDLPVAVSRADTYAQQLSAGLQRSVGYRHAGAYV
ncbi:MAG TPA: MerR family transcriptional regulator [Roseiflexaceae bacterium]|nr:MerR family transcriptional regulator [Roseiflexaceae bacterium]HMP39168.1 MerR family transcriptional regulator [Roseiflexaceae bacterium]